MEECASSNSSTRNARRQTHVAAAITTFRARGSFPIVSENENYEKKIDNGRFLHVDPANVVNLQTDEVSPPCEGGLLVAQIGKLKEIHAKYLGQWLENHHQEQDDGRGDHQIVGMLLQPLPPSLRRQRRILNGCMILLGKRRPCSTFRHVCPHRGWFECCGRNGV